MISASLVCVCSSCEYPAVCALVMVVLYGGWREVFVPVFGLFTANKLTNSIIFNLYDWHAFCLVKIEAYLPPRVIR
jgi:hypothetical protein